jgi:hypothetical protein
MPADPNRSIDRNKSIETIEGKELETIIDKNNFSLLVNNSRLKNMDSDLMIKWLSTIIGLVTAVVGTSSLLYDKFVLPYTNPIKITLEADVKEVKNPGTKLTPSYSQCNGQEYRSKKNYVVQTPLGNIWTHGESKFG